MAPCGPSLRGTRPWPESRGNDHYYKTMTARLSDLLLNRMGHQLSQGGKLHRGWSSVQLEEVTELGRPGLYQTINSVSKFSRTLSVSQASLVHPMTHVRFLLTVPGPHFSEPCLTTLCPLFPSTGESGILVNTLHFVPLSHAPSAHAPGIRGRQKELT